MAFGQNIKPSADIGKFHTNPLKILAKIGEFHDKSIENWSFLNMLFDSGIAGTYSEKMFNVAGTYSEKMFNLAGT